jgi:uncharacterized protein DUF4145
MSQFNWTCPHCFRPQVATEHNRFEAHVFLRITKLDIGDVGTDIAAFSCLNEECRKLTLAIKLREWLNRRGPGDDRLGTILEEWRLVPQSSTIPQPEYIPAPLREDYYEACRVRDLSPKAAATLARRCLQGMIRHFCGISKARLIDEISALREAVETGKAPRGVTVESVDAIDHVRKIGNIGAHMERDVNLVIDIDPGEAQILIELIEMLFDEWYVEQQNRTERLKKIAAIGAEKSTTKVPKPDTAKS